jgi:hypothetical protein
VTSPTMTSTASRPKLPAGLRWSNVWRNPNGDLTQGERELPVNADWRIDARLYLCPTIDCTTEEWTFGSDDTVPCCPRHPQKLVETLLDGTDRNPVTSARAKLTDRVRAVYAERRKKAIDGAKARAEAAREAAAHAMQRTAADLQGHKPSLYVSAGVLAAGEVLAQGTDPLVTAAVGMLLATGGGVVAYVAAYVAQRLRAEAAMVGRTGKKARARARHIAAAVMATGLWLLATAPAVALSPIWGGAASMLGGCLATWVVNRGHWDRLWEDRRRVKALAAQKHVAAAERAEQEAEQLEHPTAVVPEGELTPLEMGRRMAARWVEISRSDTVPMGFLMGRCRIVPEETVEITAPIDGEVVRIGWEYAIQADPGVLVARFGGSSPLVGARLWLASMLGVDPAMVSLIDQPEGRVNHGQLTITDRYTLSDLVRWKGPRSVRRDQDGSIWAHGGTTMNGDDVYEPIYIPGQPFGGLTVGHTGAGKSVGVRLSLLNDLSAGILPTMHDPAKSLADFAEFVGVIPMGCTPEHRDVIIRSLRAERVRRTKHINSRTIKDRHGRKRPEPAEFDVTRDGPPIRHYWEEFHRNAADKPFVALFLDLLRVQRSAAMGAEIITQGGGLADLGDSVLRGLVNQITMRLYRMPDNLARLAGYTGDYMPSSLPRVPGTVLLAGKDAPPVPLRTAFVHRVDEDGSVYDQLYSPDGTPLLTAPALPPETLEVFEREGLMDLWRLGKGPNGLTNLMDDGAQGGPPVVDGKIVVASTGRLPVADVLLGIVHIVPGCPRAQLDDPAVWVNAPGWSGPADPSTISRAAKGLVTDGLIVRDKNEYRLTAKGTTRGAQVAALLSGQVSNEPSAAELEQQAEADAEARELAEAGQ